MLNFSKFSRLAVPARTGSASYLSNWKLNGLRAFASAFPIIWTKIDEAPALASYALLPVVEAFARRADVDVLEKDISLAGRIIANFPEKLKAEQKIADELAALGEIVQTPTANVIKLPNISASIPQLEEAIAELQKQGYAVPSYPREPANKEEEVIKERYAKVLGSAVNPVLREGNSDRRAAVSVKKFAQKYPHKMMKKWPAPGESKTRVVYMSEGDFFGSEVSTTIPAAATAKIVFTGKDGSSKVLKDGLKLQAGEVLDATHMDVAKLRTFFADSIKEAKEKDLLLSLHMKATMMKVSDPVIFGHAVSVFFDKVFEKHGAALKAAGANVNNGWADVLEKLEKKIAEPLRSEIKKDIDDLLKTRPALAMVDSKNGITNLHVPNDVIVDASMPVVVRDGGRMWNAADKLQDTLAMIPDRCYATMYQTIIADAQKNGQFDPSTMGAVSNVGLMAQKAEEYGSHDKTFLAPGDGKIEIVDTTSGKVLLQQSVNANDIYRACQAKDEPIKDWVRLAVERARLSNTPAIFWLDAKRGHDAELIKKVNAYLAQHDTKGLDIKILAPQDAMAATLVRTRAGQDTISVTGNVLRDYLTDLFPILELGTSARMLSIVPLLKGGGLFETGAGGSAPKHVEQFLEEGHLRWDSLGEYAALVPSLEMIAHKSKNPKAGVLARALDKAITSYLEGNHAPSRKVNEIDNRGSTFLLSKFWAEALATQTEDAALASQLKPIADELNSNSDKILKELLAAQGKPVDLGGYYNPDDKKARSQMNPSATLNAILEKLKKK